MKRINQSYEGDKDIKIKQYLIYLKNLSRLLINAEDIVWKEKN